MSINQDVRQGFPLSLTRFNIYIDEVRSEWLMILKGQFVINGKNFTTSLFSDDQLIIGSSEDSIQEAVHKSNQVAEQYNMAVFTDKREVIAFKGTNLLRAKLVIGNRTSKGIQISRI